MALFGIGKKKSPEVLDLTRKYGESNNSNEKRPVRIDSKSSSSSAGFDFLSNLASSSSSNSSSNKTSSDGYVSVSSSDS